MPPAVFEYETGDKEFRVEGDVTDGKATITLSGDLDMATTRHLDECVAEVQKNSEVKDPTLDVDMSAVQYIDSSGIRSILNLQREFSSAEREVAIVNPTPAVIRILEITGVVDFLHIVQPEAE